ncbi:MAG: LPP20 family lipoprotein [Gammaproteobacteria bacterium]|nr:LPP20 family lipoprotein [Gammaproteobacteria bacterium]MBL6999365.1 LPP20 family lipoprotein [Gammaproteobacteria bacterium]
MKLFALVFILCSSLGCASFALQADDPNWIYGGGMDGYRDSRYLTAVGEGSSSEDARKSAYSSLAEQLKVSISSQSNIVKEYRSTADKFEKQENMHVQISTQVNLDNIEGITIAGQHFKPGNGSYYAFAVLDKIKNAASISFQIESQFDQLRAQLEQVKKLFARSDSSEAMILLLKSSQLFKQITGDVALHQLFADAGSNSLLRDEVLSLISEFDQYLSSTFKQLSVSTVGERQQTGSSELGVSEPFNVVFSYRGQPLKRVPVAVIPEIEGAVLDHDSMTDLQGRLSVRVRSLPYTGKPENKIRVKLDLDEALFINNSPFTELVVLLGQKSDVSVQLRSNIKSKSNDYLYLSVNDGLASVLSEQNYQVYTEQDNFSGRADYYIDVQGTVMDFPGYQGMHFAKINGVINIKSGASNRTLKTIRINAEATKAGALTSDSAAEKSAALLIKAVKEDLLTTLEMNLGRK